MKKSSPVTHPVPLVLPSMLDEADLSYHRHLVQQLQTAQQAIQSWVQYLSPKYQITPQDQIDGDGKIHRA